MASAAQVGTCECRYGSSHLPFRGPRRSLAGDYVLCLGGNETFAKYVARPFPDLLDATMDMPCVNMGCANTGVDAFLKDYSVMQAALRARVVVLQVPSAHMLSNRFYTVHPRRNDRFLRASNGLRALYPEVDFTEYAFVRHLLCDLHACDAKRFAHVVAELRTGWRMRTRTLVNEIRRPVLLLWFAWHAPRPIDLDPAGGAPLFVSDEDLDTLSALCADRVSVTISAEAQKADVEARALDAAGSRPLMPGPTAHREVAEALAGPLAQLIKSAPPVTESARPAPTSEVIVADVGGDVGGPFWH